MLTVVICQIPELRIGHVADLLNDIFLIFPNYALGMGIVQLSINYQLNRQCSSQLNLEFLCDAFPENLCCARGTLFDLITITYLEIHLIKSLRLKLFLFVSQIQLPGLGLGWNWEEYFCFGSHWSLVSPFTSSARK